MGRVVFIACTNVGRAMIEAVVNSAQLRNVDISGVVNMSPEAAVGKANYDSYIDLFMEYGINHYYCNSINEPKCVEFLKACAPDIIIQSGWSQKFKEEILNIPRYACIGEHPAPLPKGRGAACVNWAIITGEHEWGDTFFRMETQYDTGSIYSQKYFNIELYDDVKTVYDKVAEAAVRAVEKNLSNWVDGRLEGRRQDDASATHYSRRKPTDGLFSFKDDIAMNIYNHIRGQARPYPGAFFHYGMNGTSRKIYVWKARIDGNPKEEEVLAYCKDGKTVILQRVQEEGKVEMWAKDYFRVSTIRE